ncbi:pro-resilin-like [Copidosoma floridanum]|uniref:pro-resilin-like n=1 Tax=Copidosoma floridanum TaxID=29053 RepID=UPI0006C94341|nr:pro-resilin-like [Copidosoma floridanum]
MGRDQCGNLLVVVLVTITTTTLTKRFTAEAQGYQYNRPSFGSDFGERAGTGRPVYGPPSGTYGAPGSGVGGSSGGPGFSQGFQGSGREFMGGGSPGANGAGRSRPYSFEYEVKDAASGNDYGQREMGDELGSVQGEYRVLLPDTRTQIVRYMADDANGYVADIHYEGEAQFPRSGGPGGFAGQLGGFQQQQGRVGGGSNAGYNSGGPNDGFVGSNNQYLPPSGSYGK